MFRPSGPRDRVRGLGLHGLLLLWGLLVCSHGNGSVGVRVRHDLCLLASLGLALSHLSAGVEMFEEGTVGAQLGPTTLTQEVRVGFVVLSHVFHQMLHAGKGAVAADGGAEENFTWEGLSRDVILVVLDVFGQAVCVRVDTMATI